MKIAGMSRLFAICLALYAGNAVAATTLLPNGKQCFSATTGVNGMIGALGSITGGSGYVNGVYGNVALTGGSGSGGTANITVAGGAVTSVLVQLPGINYVVGNTLSASNANLGGAGAGFSVPVNSIAVNASLAGGQVNMFIPATTTIKATWQDSGQAVANANPIVLDANGCAVIYGVGIYRQQLLDSLGNLIWDQLVTDTSAFNAVFWAGTAGGTANVITVVDSGFNGTDGSVIQFIPILTNSGATTLNPSSFGNVPIVKDTAIGATALTGGEIVAGSPSNVVSVVYSSSQNNFHIVNLISPTNPTTPQTLCGAIGLKIVNDSGTPNSKVDVTADQVTTTTTGGQTISRTNVSFVLNFTITGANALDTGAFAPSTWYNVWIIDNGNGAASLGSLSATAPTMPGGYSYKCRLGAVQTDGSTNLFRVLQLGNRAQYQLIAATNTANAPLAASGTAGTNCTSSPVTWASVSLTTSVPPTATSVDYTIFGNYNGGTLAVVLAAPNNQWWGTSSAARSPFSIVGTATGQSGLASWASLLMETAQTMVWCSSATGGALFIDGWRDKVNAN